MTIHATFQQIEHQAWDWRVVITAVYTVYMRRSVGPQSSASIVDRIVWRLGNVLLDS